MSLTKSSKTGLIISLVTAGVVLLIGGFLFFNRQFVSDSIISMFYTPSPAIMAIDERVGFTDDGARIFRATQPEVSSSELFNTRCPRQEQASPIIGCYTADDRIYIFDVTNAQLDGIEEVTAAHETLHAVWERLGADEQAKLGVLLEEAYKRVADEDLKTRVEYYSRTEPGEFHNELHSMLGTEFANLGTELEAHYARYFEDRSKILALHEQYDTLYDELHSRSEELYTKLDSMATEIRTARSNYDTGIAQLSKDIDDFNRRANNGGFSSEAAFYAERAELVSRTQSLENDRLTLNANVDTYNSLHKEYMDVASKLELLNKSLDSFETIDPRDDL